MKKFIFFLLTALSQLAVYSQIEMKETIGQDEPYLFSSTVYEGIITRHNSCSIHLLDFLFQQNFDDKFLVDLTIKLNSYKTGSTEPIRVKKIRVLFKDVIELKDKDKPTMLSLSNKKLADNIILSDITDIDIDIKLIPIINLDQTTFSIISPILNTVIQGSDPVINLIDNFIAKNKKEDANEVLTFHTNIHVPMNIIEFRKVEKDTTRALIRNNEILGIVYSGQTTAAYSESLLGEAKNFINGITKLVSGKKVIPKNELQYTGVMKIKFTKDENPLLPPSINNELYKINSLQNSADIENAYKEFKVEMKKIGSASTNALIDGEINNQIDYSIKMYLRLGEIYMDYLSKSMQGALSKNDAWVNKFKAFDNNINYQGVSNGIQGVGIDDIYESSNKVAKLYVPYSLPEQLTLSFYAWQIRLHNVLSDIEDKSLLKKKKK